MSNQTQTTTTTTSTTKTRAKLPDPGIAVASLVQTKRGGTMVRKNPERMLAFAMKVGGTVVLDAKTKADMEAAGIPERRIANAVCDLKKFYGVQIEAKRTGRNVSAYVFPTIVDGSFSVPTATVTTTEAPSEAPSETATEVA